MQKFNLTQGTFSNSAEFRTFLYNLNILIEQKNPSGRKWTEEKEGEIRTDEETLERKKKRKGRSDICMIL